MYLLLYNKLFPNLASLNIKRCLKITEDQEFGSSLAWFFWLRISPGGLNHLKAWLELEDLIPRRLTHMAVGKGPQSLADLWQEAIVPCCMHISMGLPEYLYNMAGGFPHCKWSKEQVNKKATMFYDPVSEVSRCPFYHILLARSES